jgi:serine/threonine protein phosphatase PrpC
MTIFIGTNGLSYAPGNAQDVGRRTEQEDSFGFSDPTNHDFMAHSGLLAVVADGIGGLAHGAEASRIAVQSFLDVYSAKDREEPVAKALRRALEAADRAVFGFAESVGLQKDVGSTLVAAAFTAEGLHWISIGDSAIYLFRRPKLTRLNHPHTLAARLEQMVERGEISAEAARIDPDRDALTSYIGTGGLVEVDAGAQALTLASGDLVVLCSDGLFRALAPDDIAAAIDSAPDGQAACDSLIRQALDRNLPHQDNVTVLCVKIGQA